MRIESVTLEEVGHVSLPWGKIIKTIRGKELSVQVSMDNGGFEVSLSPSGLRLHYTIHRPGHDHNNRPTIAFDMPEGGKVIEGKNSATLTVRDDSSHLSLEMKYDNYVWETGLDLVVEQWEHKRLRGLYDRKGLEALLEGIGRVSK